MWRLLGLMIAVVPTFAIAQEVVQKTPEAFVSKEYNIVEKIKGDLNKDGIEDVVLLIKGRDKRKFVTDSTRGPLDRNRRGLVIVFNKKDHYELAETNYTCFSSENEEGGAYYQPELSIEIKKGNLYIHYAHGRYGYWQYTFRSGKSGFDLIGYDAMDGGSPVNSETSINFLTKKKYKNQNTFETNANGDDVFKGTWSKIAQQQLLKLKAIKDFDELEMPD